MGCFQSSYSPEVSLNFTDPRTPDEKEYKVHAELEHFYKEKKIFLLKLKITRDVEN